MNIYQVGLCLLFNGTSDAPALDKMSSGPSFISSNPVAVMLHHWDSASVNWDGSVVKSLLRTVCQSISPRV